MKIRLPISRFDARSDEVTLRISVDLAELILETFEQSQLLHQKNPHLSALTLQLDTPLSIEGAAPVQNVSVALHGACYFEKPGQYTIGPLDLSRLYEFVTDHESKKLR